MARRKIENLTEIYLQGRSKQPYNYNPSKREQELKKINKELSDPPSNSKDLKSYSSRQAYYIIGQKIDDLRKMGYDIKYDNNKRPFFQNKTGSYVYHITRIVKLRFKCNNYRCLHGRKNTKQTERQHIWTTYRGLVEFSFYFEPVFEKDNFLFYLLRFNFKPYGQQCLNCSDWGSGSVIETDMYNLALVYSIVLEIVLQEAEDLSSGFKLYDIHLNGKQPGKGKKNKNKPHQSQLCEACKLGKCMNSSHYQKKADNPQKITLIQ